MSSPKKSLDEMALEYLRDMHSRVKEHWRGHDLPRLSQRVAFVDDGYVTEGDGGIAWMHVVYKTNREAPKSPHADAFASALRELGLPYRLAPNQEVEWEDLRERILLEALPVLGDAYVEAGNLEVADVLLVKHWRRWEAHWSAKVETHIVVVPILRTGHLPATASLAPGVDLHPFTRDFKQRLWRPHLGVFNMLPLDEFTRARVVLQVHGSEQRGVGLGTAPELELASRAVLALRLATDGDVSPAGAIHLVAAPRIAEPSPLLHFRVIPRPIVSLRPLRESSLSQETCAAAATIYEQLTALASRKRMAGLALPLRRFEQTFTRDWPEDVIVDLAIILESTLLADNPFEELRYRTALRGAAFLADSHAPQVTYDLLRHLYDLRSAIVHTGRGLSDLVGNKHFKWLQPELFVQECEALVRSILRRMVEVCAAGEKVTSIIAALDAAILAGVVKQHDRSHA